MRTDRRVQKTQSAVMQAFEKLLMNKSYDDITIQDIDQCVISHVISV